MTKYTIKKAFEKVFPHPIWKIEVDCAQQNLAIEYRDPESTKPYFAVVDFTGNQQHALWSADEKEWTLEGIQGEFLILKRFGSSSPIEAGIQIVHYPSGKVTAAWHEYVLHDVYQDTLLARHRSIPGGLNFHIHIATGQVTNTPPEKLEYPPIDIHYPIAYSGHLPDFIQDIAYIEDIWLLPYQDNFIWAYHSMQDEKYDLQLILSSKNEIHDHKNILIGLDRLIPQPFFQVKQHIFFLSNTKQEIVAYLV